VADHGPGCRALSSPKRLATVAGAPAAYLEAGRGRPVVFVHGAGGRGEVWLPQLAGLADVARLVAVDLPGHGGSEGRGCRSVDDYAAWLLALLAALGLERVVLVGHSMGGAIAQTVALAQPERLDGLVLVGTGARLRVLPRILELLRDDPPRGASLIASLAYSPRTAPGAVIEAERALAATPALVTLGDFGACDRFDVMAKLGGVRVPTLVVVGRDDRLTPPKYAGWLAATIPGARLVEVEAAGHFPQLEQAAAVNAALRAFLAALP
jgi:pimeloyl-ACP methyl ester carboxylesterase